MKRDLAGVDVLVPVRIDSQDRLENLGLVLGYFAECFEGQRVTVLEHAAEAVASETAAAGGAEHVFLRTQGCFHKSRVLNLGVALADRPIVLVYDCDVLFPPAALVEARRSLREGSARFVYPYNGLLLQIARERVRAAAGAGALLAELPARVAGRDAELPAGVEFLHGSAAEPSSGAALMALRRGLLLAGGYNENIVSYGCEDTELATRLARLGLGVEWLEGYSAYHVAHHRGGDSRYNNFHTSNLAEWRKVEAMSRDELEAYVRNGFRALELDSRATLVVRNDPGEYSMRVEHASAHPLDDTVFVVALRSGTTALRNVLERMLADLDRAYDNYELLLVEIGGYDYQPSSHRDHVLYVHAERGADWLTAALSATRRPVVCACTPFTDLAPERLLPALAAVRSSEAAVETLPARAAEGLAADRAARVGGVLARALPLRGDAFVFSHEAWLADAGAVRRRVERGARLRRPS